MDRPWECWVVSELFPPPRDVIVVRRPGRRGRRRGAVIHVQKPIDYALVYKRYSGIADVYSKIYRSETELDKIVFDLDAPRDGAATLEDMWVETCEALDRLQGQGLAGLAVFSGRRGFHLYVPAEPVTPSDPATASMVLKANQLVLAQALGIRHADEHLLGSVSYQVRLPNTVHTATGNHAIPLTRADCSRDIYWVIDAASRPRCPPHPGGDRYVFRVDAVPAPPAPHSSPGLPRQGHGMPAEKARLYRLLSLLVRPCILLHVFTDPEPDHWARTYFVLELCWLGYTAEDIEDIIAGLGWADYDPRITRYHVRRLCDKVEKMGLMPPTCSRIRARGWCLGDKCPYYPEYTPWWRLYKKRG